MRKHGKDHNSVVNDMLFPIADLDNVVPALLHIHLGIVLYLYNLLEKECIALDLVEGLTEKQTLQSNALKTELETILREIENNNEEMMKLSSDLVDLENIQERLSVINSNDNRKTLDSLITKIADNKKRRAILNNECQSEVCLISELDTNREWIACTTCKNWIHNICEGQTETEALKYNNNEDFSYNCLHCQNVTNFAMHLQSKMDVVKSQLNGHKQTEISLNKKYDIKNNEIIDIIGGREKELNNSLNTINVYRQTYHGYSFVGNHCKKILEHYELLCNVINDQPEKCNNFKFIFKLFAEPRNLLFAKRFLQPNEINFVEEKCHTFGAEFPQRFGNLTMKMHEYSFTVPRFVRNFHTLGLLSEEEGESLHASINMEYRNLLSVEYRNLLSVRQAEYKMQLSLKRQSLRSQSDKCLLQPIARLCKCLEHGKGSERHFLKNGKCDYCGSSK